MPNVAIAVIDRLPDSARVEGTSSEAIEIFRGSFRFVTEATVLPYLHPDVHVIGESTEFQVGVVLKGDQNLKSYVLHHYRLANPSGVGLNGPVLVSFDSKPRGHYLLFLTHEADGRYAPVAGQVDSAKSIFKLESGYPPPFLP